jgi:hypothetical protein
MNEFITITRPTVKRAWTDLEPKLYWALMTGVAAKFVITAMASMGFPLAPALADALPFVFTFLGGYFVPSAGVAVTTHNSTENGETTTTRAHTGPAVDVITGAVPIQGAPAGAPAFSFAPVSDVAQPGRYDHILNNIGKETDTDQQATQVLRDSDH